MEFIIVVIIVTVTFIIFKDIKSRGFVNNSNVKSKSEASFFNMLNFFHINVSMSFYVRFTVA